ncbi:MAG: trehalose-phosphatase [Micrococcaceae bacterium]
MVDNPQLLMTDSALLKNSLSIDKVSRLAHSPAIQALDPELTTALKTVAREPNLLIATDYDGTIAPLADKPHKALPTHDSLVGLRALASLPQTDTAVISGRSLRDLAAISRLPNEVHLVGSHGSEFDVGYLEELPKKKKKALKKLIKAGKKLAKKRKGVFIEKKPHGIAIHYRNAPRENAELVARKTQEFADELNIYRTHGKKVIDLSVIKTSKGKALKSIRKSCSASAAVYFGDGIADEKAFKTLRGPDIGIKVGSGKSRAQYSVKDPEEVAIALSYLFESRRAWLFGEEAVPIERFTLIGNGNNSAILTPDAKVCWMTHPMPDSESLFAHLLGGEPAGYFGIESTNGTKVLGQRYIRDSMVAETRWAEFKVIDYFAPVSEGQTCLVRVIEGTSTVKVKYVPRPGYASAPFNLEVTGNKVSLNGVGEVIELYSNRGEFSINQEGNTSSAELEVDLSEDKLILILRLGHFGYEPEFAKEELVRNDFIGESHNWMNELEIPSFKTQIVKRSALLLRALCHKTTGGVLAAATTSLPEGIGGIRNWDYRYCWLRDGSMTVNALVNLGSTEEATRFLDWLARILEESNGAQWLKPLYPLDGKGTATEAVLDHLPGYAGSRPVRIGNAADHQVQLDVFGPIAQLIDNLTHVQGAVTDFQWGLLSQMVEAVQARWMEEDHGIWEARMMPRHHVYTKVMCWFTIDRALHVAKTFGRQFPDSWKKTADTIREEVLEKGWSEKSQSYTVAYDSDDADSAILHIGLTGLIDMEDERFKKTVAFIEKELRVGPTVFRYRYDDGLPGLEGGFHICTTWLIEALVGVGRIDDALELYGKLCALGGPTGNMPEEYDPAVEMHLGNTPQAYSHIGLIRCAQLLQQYRS